MEVSDFGKYRAPPHNLIPSRDRAGGARRRDFLLCNQFDYLFIGMFHDWNGTSKHWNQTMQYGIFHAAPRRPLKLAGDVESCLALSLIKNRHG